MLSISPREGNREAFTFNHAVFVCADCIHGFCLDHQEYAERAVPVRRVRVSLFLVCGLGSGLDHVSPPFVAAAFRRSAAMTMSAFSQQNSVDLASFEVVLLSLVETACAG